MARRLDQTPERKQEDELAFLRQVNMRLRSQLALARAWYVEDSPFEEGADEVYPWDHP